MKRTKRHLIAISAVAALSIAAPIIAQAQTFTGLGVLDDMGIAISSAGKKLINVAFAMLGITGILALAPAAAKWFKGEPQSKDALTNIGIGLIIGAALLGIMKMIFSF